MDAKVHVLNRSHDAEDEILIRQYSGDPDLLPEAILRAVFKSDHNAQEWSNGDWFVVVDGEEVSGPNGTHPFQVSVEADDEGGGEDVTI